MLQKLGAPRERESKPTAGILKYLFVFLVLLFGFFQSITPVFATTLLSDDFTGTTINASKWLEVDVAGAGGTTGNVQQNGSLTVANSLTSPSTWGTNALVSVDSFDSNGLEVSAIMTAGSAQLLGYGDYNFSSAGTSAYIIDLSSSSGPIYALSKTNGTTSASNLSCGTVTNGATYKMIIISGGFEVYKNSVLQCTLTTSVVVNNKPIFLESSTTASTFDDVLVAGNVILTAPDAPTGLSATAGNTEVSLSWTAPSNGGSVITDYVIEYKLTSEPTTWLTFNDGTSTATSTTVTGLTNSSSYDFRVSAMNVIGTGVPSSTSSATPSTATTVLTDNFTGTTIDTSKWIEVDNAGIGGTSGDVQQNGSLTVANSYVSLTWGATALYSQATFSSSSLEISAVMTPNSDQLLGYGDYNFQGAGTKAYIVDLTGGNVVALSREVGGSPGSTSCGVATNGATYKMKIISGGFEVYKNGTLVCTLTTSVVVNNKPIFLESSTTASIFDDVLVKGIPPTAPNAPTIGTATAGNAQASITFTPPGSNGGSTITSYTVTSSPGGFTGTGSASPIIVTGLTNGTAYTFTVTATNTVGTSPASASSNSVTPSVPAPPDQVTGVSVTGVNKQVLISWVAPGGAAITDYLIEYKASSASTWVTFNDGTSTNIKTVVTGLVNGTAYDFRVSAINSGGTGTASTTSSATPNAINTLAFVITGESNSGGIGSNASATAHEISDRPAVQITNLTSGTFLYEDLHIGVNNLRDHAGLESYYDTSHGFELQLANSVEANAFPDNPQVYLTKTGQGGSRIAQWNVGGTYWTKFLQRTAAAKTQLPTQRQWVVWLSLGINDGIDGTPTDTFQTALIAHINKIKADLPGAIIIMTEFEAMPANSGYPAINTVLRNIAASEANVYSVDTTGTTTDGGNHWIYAGLKQVTLSMITITNNALGLIYPGIPTAVTPTASSGQVSLSWTAPVSNGGSAITDYLVEYKTTAGSTWLTFADGVSTGTSATVTGLTNETSYDFRISGINANGTGNASNTATAVTPDTTAPTISAVTSTPNTSGATITWTTNENSSSKINYGLTNSYGSNTTETNTSPRVSSHSVSLSSLVACSTYHYRVRSIDAATNETIDSDNTFTTTGCTGSAAVDSQTTSTITTAAGGSLSLLSDSKGITLTVPASFAGSDANFQIKQLDKTSVINTTSTPTGYSLINSYLYDLKALSGVSTTITIFDNPLTITMTYGAADISGIDESTLIIYRWDGSVWNQLTGCTVNNSAKTVTCTTTNFSVFGLFGQASSSSTSSSSNSNSSTSNSVCNDQTPGSKAPWLYGAIAQDSSSVLLYFTEADNPVNKYVLEYGTKSGDYPYGVQDMGVNSRGQMTFLVKSLSPNTTYYFRVRGGNGCATGNWSNEISAKTKGLVSFNQLEITQSQLEPQPVAEIPSNTSCQTYTIKSGDTLWSIAKNLLGDGNKYKEIIEQNKDKYSSLSDSNNISSGWELKINCGKQTVTDETKKPTETQGGYDVKVKVVDTAKKPIEGATVTLHSTPQTTKTDKNGVASFSNVEAGDHKVLIAYNNFEGEQSINLTGDVKEFDLNVTVQQKAISLSPLAYGIIGVMGLVIIGLIILVIKLKRKE